MGGFPPSIKNIYNSSGKVKSEVIKFRTALICSPELLDVICGLRTVSWSINT